jgi:hypothetical protein
MPVSLSESTATLTGVVTVEDAEPLAQWLRSSTGLTVLMADCTHLHTAALQALLAGRPTLGSVATDPFLARWVTPLLTGPNLHDPTDLDRSST